MRKLVFSLLFLSPLLLASPQRTVFAKSRRAAAAASSTKREVARSRGRSRSDFVDFPGGDSLRVERGPVARSREYRDAVGTGNPLLHTGGRNRSKKLSKDITVADFARSGDRTFPFARIDPQFIDCLQDLHDYVGRPLRIDSGYRSFSYNREVYRRMRKRPTDSKHTAGRAADVKITGMTGRQIAEAAIDACGSDVGLGLGPRYAHIDRRGRLGVWKYGGVSGRQVAQVRRYGTLRQTARTRLQRGRRTARAARLGQGR